MVIYLDPEFHYTDYADATYNSFYNGQISHYSFIGLKLISLFNLALGQYATADLTGLDPRPRRIEELSSSLLVIIPSPIDTQSDTYSTG